MKKVLFFVPLGYLFVLLLQVEKAFTQDLGRHLKLGELILQCQCVPKTNLFSYTYPDFPFVNHHWLPEVLFYLSQQIFGDISIVLLKNLVIFASFILVYWWVYKNTSAFVATTLAIPYIFIFSERFDARPEVFSFLFLSLFFVMLATYKRTLNWKYLLPLPLIQLLWVNSHIYFFLGPLVFGFLLCELLIRRKLTIPVVVIFLTTSAINVFNPHGITGALYPFLVFGNYGYTIVENQNVFFLNSFFFNPRILVYELLALGSLVLLVVAVKKREIFFGMVLLFSLWAAGYMIRNFPIFVLIGFPAAAVLLHSVLKKTSQKWLIQVQRPMLGLLIGAALIHTVLFVVSPYFGVRYVVGAEKAVAFYRSQNFSGNIFNNFDIGSYLIYRLYPEQKVFIDGRPEAYPAAFFDEYKRMQTDPEFFKQQINRYTIHTIIFAHTDMTPWAQEFLQTIVRNPEWVPVYLDERMIIWAKDIPEHAQIIQKYKVSL